MGKEVIQAGSLHRRAQMTAFGIFAVVVVIAAVLTSYIGQQQAIPREEIPKQVTHPPHVQAVKDFVAACVNDAAEDAVILTLATAGYGADPPAAIEGLAPITILYQNGKSFVPSEEKVKDSLRKAAEASVRECANFERMQMEVAPESIGTDVQLQEGKVRVVVRYPLVITRGGVTYRLDDSYTTAIPVDVKSMVTHVQKIVDEVKLSPLFVPLTDMVSDQFYVQANPVDEKTILYQIVDVQKTIGEVNPTFLFATKR